MKPWVCPRCGDRFEFIDHPSVKPAHRCHPPGRTARTVQLIADGQPAAGETNPKPKGKHNANR